MSFGFARFSFLFLLSFLLFNPIVFGAYFSRTQVLMGDVPVTLTIKTSPQLRLQAYQAMEEAFKKAKSIEIKVSEFQPASETSQMNRFAGLKAVTIGDDLLQILKAAQQISELSDGAFDLTFASKIRHASYRDIILDEKKSTAKLQKKGEKIGVSGIAKGYIVGKMSQTLKQLGFSKHMVNAGGDIYASGSWTIILRKPYFSEQNFSPLCRLRLKNQAASTSGNYERGRHINADYYLSVTVVHASPLFADAMATAAFILPSQKTFPSATMIWVQKEGIQILGNLKITCSKFQAL